jgi:hypothetical protein
MHKVVNCSNTGIVGSNPTRGKDVCLVISCVVLYRMFRMSAYLLFCLAQAVHNVCVSSVLSCTGCSEYLHIFYSVLHSLFRMSLYLLFCLAQDVQNVCVSSVVLHRLYRTSQYLLFCLAQDVQNVWVSSVLPCTECSEYLRIFCVVLYRLLRMSAYLILWSCTGCSECLRIFCASLFRMFRMSAFVLCSLVQDAQEISVYSVLYCRGCLRISSTSSPSFSRKDSYLHKLIVNVKSPENRILRRKKKTCYENV